MAATVVETIQTKSARRSDGTNQVDRTFIVYSQDPTTDFAQGAFDVDLAVRSAFGIEIGEAHPDAGVYTATDLTIDPLGESNFAWSVVWTYSNTGGGDPTQGIGKPIDTTEPGYYEYTSDHNFTFIDFFREEAIDGLGLTTLHVPVNGTLAASDILMDDIGGLPIDESGTPTSIPVLQQTFEYSQTFTEATADALGPIWLSFVGTRNLGIYRGSSPGRVLYLGHSRRRAKPGVCRVTHRFHWDQYYHMRQIAAAVGGEVQVGPYRDMPTTRDYAQRVTWVQPFPTLGNWLTLFG